MQKPSETAMEAASKWYGAPGEIMTLNRLHPARIIDEAFAPMLDRIAAVHALKFAAINEWHSLDETVRRATPKE